MRIRITPLAEEDGDFKFKKSRFVVVDLNDACDEKVPTMFLLPRRLVKGPRMLRLPRKLTRDSDYFIDDCVFDDAERG